MTPVSALRRFFFVCALGALPLAANAGVDLLINLSDSPDPVAAGGNVAYALRVNNDSFDTPATGVVTTHSIPATMVYRGTTGGSVSCSGMSLGQAGPASLTCSLPDLALGSAAVSYTVTLETTRLGVYTFDARVRSNESDDQPANNSGDDTTTVRAGANLAMRVLPANATGQSGTAFAWTLQVSNAGPDAAKSVRVQNPVPTGFSVSVIPNGCTLAADLMTCTLPEIAAGTTFTVGDLAGTIIAAGGSTVSNSASVSITDADEAQDPVSSNNTATANLVVTGGSDLALTKVRNASGNLLVGASFNFILTPTYTGEVPTSITVRDTLPVNYSLRSVAASQNGWTCGVSGQTVTCTRPGGGVAGVNQALGVITIPVTVASAGTGVVNTATLSAVAPSDPNLANNTASDSPATLIATAVDLTIRKTAPSPALAVVGAPFSFTLVVGNNGSSGYLGTLRIRENLPAGLTLTGFTANGWACPAVPITGPATVDCTRSTAIPAGGTAAPLGVTVVAANPGTVVNNAGVIADTCNVANCNDGDTSSATVTVSLAIDAADLRLQKQVDLANVGAGEVLTYTLRVFNDGPATATSVTLADNFFTLINSNVGATGAGYIGESFNAGAASGVSCSSTAASSTARRLVCMIASLPPCSAGTCPVFSVRVRPGGPGGERVNTASVSSSVNDPDLDNNTASATNTVLPRADLVTSVNATPNPVPAGQQLSYTVAVRNAGPNTADNANVTATLPTDVSFVSVSAASGTCTTALQAGETTTAARRTVTCTFGALANGVQRAVTLIVRPNGSTANTTITLGANATTTSTERDVINNSAIVTTAVGAPAFDLIINKVDSVDPLPIGNDTVYTVTVTHRGASAASNVVVTDTLPPAGLAFQSFTTPQGSCTAPAVGSVGGTLVCTLGTLQPETSRILTVTLRGVAKGVHTNTATVVSNVTGVSEDDSNNTQAEQTTVRTKADMQVVSKTPSANPVNLRQAFNFVVRVRNNPGEGLAEADNVVVSDTLPAGMELTATPTLAVVNGTTTQATCSGAAGGTSFSCNLGSVSLGAVLDISVPVRQTVTTTLPETFTNTARVATSSFDINPGNDSASGQVTVVGSSLAGRVFRDPGNDGAVSAGDSGIAGVTLTLTGTSSVGVAINRTTTTGADGQFVFSGLPQGTYRVAETFVNSAFLLDGIDTAGSAGGTVGNDVISAIALPPNTAATGYLFAEVPLPVIGVAKAAAPVVNNGDGTYSVVFSLRVINAGETPLSAVQVNDALTGALPKFGTYTANSVPAAGQYTVSVAPSVSAPVNGAALAPASNFTGSGSTTGLLVEASSSLPSFGAGRASAATVSFGLRFFPAVLGSFENTALAGGAPPTGPRVTDDSVDGPDPDANGDGDPRNDTSPTRFTLAAQQIAISKTAGDVQTLSPQRFRIPYAFVVSNPAATATATFVQVSDPLAQAFPNASALSVAAAPVVSECSGTLLLPNPAYNGGADARLLDGTRNLQAGERCTIRVVVEATFTNVPPESAQTNRATATTAATPGGPALASAFAEASVNLPVVQAAIIEIGGVVYDAVTRAPIAGASVTLLANATAVDTLCFSGGVNAQTTGASGVYQFFLTDPAPPGCPGTATYTLAVGNPAAYLPPDSTLIPPTPGPYPDGTLGGIDSIQPQSTPPMGPDATVYYTRLAMTLSGAPTTSSSAVVNNHLPLDPVAGDRLVLTKSTPLVNVSAGQQVPYTITARNTQASALVNVNLIDTLPPGFKFQTGSASVDGVAVTPTLAGRTLTFGNLSFAPQATRTIRLVLVVGAGAQPGEYVNTALAVDNRVNPNPPISNLASATVRVIPEPVFDCSDLVGKVFDDRNANAYQDDGEPGLPNVRLATARGWLVTTDADGRYHVACAAIPDADRGSNFILKLDERTLPTGYRVTTENPRDVRLTRGKLAKLNFGATIHKVVRVDVTDAAFTADGTLAAEWAAQLGALAERLRARPSVLRLGYKVGADGADLGRERLRRLAAQLRTDWSQAACCHSLLIEEELFLPAPAKGGK